MILFYNVDYFKSACTKAFTGNIYRAKRLALVSLIVWYRLYTRG